MSDNEVYERLKESFPQEAYSRDDSRGFELTSIKAAFIFERLNEVFGLCGTGWRYAHATFELETSGGGEEVMTEVVLQYRNGDDNACGRAEWDAMLNTWKICEAPSGAPGWSEPIFSPGGKRVVKGRFTDARKSAVTDGITKAASMIGIGHDVFKGQVRVGQSQPQRQQSSGQAEQIRDRATTQVDGKIGRPLNPDQLKKAIEIKAGQGKGDPASEKQASAVASLFQQVWGDDSDAEDKYHKCLFWLSDVKSATDLTKGEASAYMDLIKESKDSWDLHPKVEAEMNLVLARAIEDHGAISSDPDSTEAHQEAFEQLTS